MEQSEELPILPSELVEEVASYLPSRQRASLRRIDRRHRDLFDDDYWKRLVRLEYPDELDLKAYPWVSWAEYYDLLSTHPLLRPSVFRRALEKAMGRKSYRVADEAIFFVTTSLKPIARAISSPDGQVRTQLLRRMDVNRFDLVLIAEDPTGVAFVNAVAAKLWVWCLSSSAPTNTYGFARAFSRCLNAEWSRRFGTNALFEAVGFPRSLFEPKRSAVPASVFEGRPADGLTAETKGLVENVLHAFGTANLWSTVEPYRVSLALGALVDECRRLSGLHPVGPDAFLWVLRRHKVVYGIDFWSVLEAADRTSYP